MATCYQPPPVITPNLESESVLSGLTHIQDGFKALSMVMLINYLFPKQAKLKDGDEFDFIIVGGGTAGCVMANRLVTANYSVLVLEAGDVQPFDSFLPGSLVYLLKSKSEWNYRAVPDNFTAKCHKRCDIALPIGKVLGGSSSITYMLASRGILYDYHLWAVAANDSSWEYRHLLPYFKRSERLQAPRISDCNTGSCRGVGGPPPDAGGPGNIGIAQDNGTSIDDYLDAFEEMGNEIVEDLSGRHSVGYTRALFTLAEGYRQSTAYGYLTPVKNHPKLSVARNTIVTKIVFDKKKNAIGVKASINGKKEIFLRAKKEVIVCAGAIKSPQLLMLSGIGPKKHLKEKNITVISDLPVGENFQDHPMVLIMHKTKKIPKPGSFNYQDFPAVGTVIGYKSLEPCAGIPDYGTFSFIAKRIHFLIQYCALPFDFQHEICDRSYKQTYGRTLLYTHVVNLYPKSRGKVMLDTTNPNDAPLVKTGLFTKKQDVDDFVSYIKDFLGIVNTTYFRNVDASLMDPIDDKCDAFEFGSDDYWKCYVHCMSTSLWNYGGTCAMGSVVDSKLKVYGVNRLRVVDASVMPNIVTGGNYVATVVIAEKASDIIKRAHKNK